MERKTNKNRKKILFLIDKTNYNLLMEYVENKYQGQSKHGAISNELNRALNIYLHGHKDARKCMNPPIKVETVYHQTKKHIIENFGCTNQTTLWMIEEGIRKVRGDDPRTVYKWIKTFVHWKLIKETAPNVWNMS